MFNELPPERRAFCLTRMIYRDTEELEARHVDQGAMDMAFYGTMHGVVAESSAACCATMRWWMASRTRRACLRRQGRWRPPGSWRSSGPT